ncbi:MAG: carbonic anhydrase [Alphaproteobacteria bacterium]|nr:carbonic anhydrase [Alphaproteobacteria bacterium]
MPDIDKLLDGYQQFHQTYFQHDNSLYQSLQSGQNPKALIIACSDSRADPGIITHAAPGDIFVIRNVASLVPPYKENNRTIHGTSAALEFAVRILQVEHIIVLGHSHCAGVKAMATPDSLPFESDFIEQWVEIAKPAKQRALDKCSAENAESNDSPELLHHCERETVLLSLNNLTSFPWIKQRIDDGKLKIHGWYFSIDNGALSHYDPKSQNFIPFATE